MYLKARKQKHTQRHDKRASSQPLPPPAVLAGVAPHQQQQHRETQRQMSQPPPFRQVRFSSLLVIVFLA